MAKELIKLAESGSDETYKEKARRAVKSFFVSDKGLCVEPSRAFTSATKVINEIYKFKNRNLKRAFVNALKEKPTDNE